MNSCSQPKLCPRPLYRHVLVMAGQYGTQVELLAERVLTAEEIESVIEDSRTDSNERTVQNAKQLNVLADFPKLSVGSTTNLLYAGVVIGTATLTQETLYGTCYETRVSATSESIQPSEDEGGRLVSE